MGARRLPLALLCTFAACAAGVQDRPPDPPAPTVPAVDSAAAAPEPSAATPPPAPAPSPAPPWASGSASERLYALRVNDDGWARRDLLTWTTAPQVDAVRQSRVLLVSTANAGGPPSPFVWLASRLSRRRGPAGALAALLSNDPRFARRRYAWTAAFATVLGLSGKRYGNELVAVRLRADALVVSLAPERDPPIAVRDLDQHEVPLDQALDQAGRIGAVYHVRTGKDVPTPFREYVLVNEAAIERWAVGTPDVRAEVEAEAALLRDLRAALETAPPGPRQGGPFDAWWHVEATAALRPLWEGSLAFRNDRYVLSPDRLAAAISALEEYDRAAPEIEVRP